MEYNLNSFLKMIEMIDTAIQDHIQNNDDLPNAFELSGTHGGLLMARNRLEQAIKKERLED